MSILNTTIEPCNKLQLKVVNCRPNLAGIRKPTSRPIVQGARIPRPIVQGARKPATTISTTVIPTIVRSVFAATVDPSLIQLTRVLVPLERRKTAPTRFHDNTTVNRVSEKDLNEYYHESERLAIINLFKAKEAVDVANSVVAQIAAKGIKMTSIIHDKYNEVIATIYWHLRCADILFDNAICARKHIAELHGGFDARHWRAFCLLRSEQRGVFHYVNYLDSIANDIKNINMQKPIVESYIFMEPILVADKEKYSEKTIRLPTIINSINVHGECGLVS